MLGLNILLTDGAGLDAETYDPIAMQTYTRKAIQKEQTFHFKLSYDDFSFSHYNSEQERFGNFWDAPEANYIPWSKVHLVQVTNLSHQLNIGDTWRLESHFSNIEKTKEWSSEGLAYDIIKIK